MHKATYLIAYDIASTPIRNKVFKLLSTSGFALQASVFVMWDYRQNMVATINKISEVINENEDKCLCVTLNSAGYTHSQVPEFAGITLTHSQALVDVLLNGSNKSNEKVDQ
ncbi:CRISPR-associated endonuclease Cas2 [Alteromonas ponticola]|uniref:CRISPR-associated endoribonuclease Cas2 n=1 Tax=Alteromonas aquimaris TaxID=2998417 RepID=A0ABT3PA60_9ALTE|nr:CRISPR-associated endonuclease Cas2 [Alteromonas aquimaris]MCW8109594.1 CRISPR-associated endonuclease Cas2 [Alteromonas aquimaris]